MGFWDTLGNIATGGLWGAISGGGGGGGLLGIPSSFDININKVANIDPITINPLAIDRVHDVQVTQVKDVEIDRIQRIAPLAAHIKEINNIDPLSVDAFNVTEVRNIEPLRIREFNITNLPNVNIALRQLPPVEVNLRRLPPVSVGLHQDFHIPSNYLVRMQFLGFELFRVALNGQSTVVPREKFRREQSHVHDRSYPLPATAGNPAIPSHCREVEVIGRPAAGCGGAADLKCGAPAVGFSLGGSNRHAPGPRRASHLG
jgi:hypothetical protein